ncbi:hypothetical protein EVAR_5989_1 [Eumeta japonica]|uniref:Uncharacterized protein n=1 Tax=Eumeta variegata TaxID=151549 RepID=A0A4C1TAI4_EUMVA|nr:hypothetical protein EVAR_5989_1 [Eumeta japonica]
MCTIFIICTSFRPQFRAYSQNEFLHLLNRPITIIKHYTDRYPVLVSEPAPVLDANLYRSRFGSNADPAFDSGHDVDSNSGPTVDYDLDTILDSDSSRSRLSILLLVPFAIWILLPITIPFRTKPGQSLVSK